MLKIALLALLVIAVPLAYAQPTLTISSTPLNQGELLNIVGEEFAPVGKAEITIFHPDGSKFGIFTPPITSDGLFQVPVEIVHTSKQGEYRIEVANNGTKVLHYFTYSGGHDIIFGKAPEPTPEPIVESLESTNSTSTNSTSTNTTTEETTTQSTTSSTSSITVIEEEPAPTNQTTNVTIDLDEGEKAIVLAVLKGVIELLNNLVAILES